MYDCKSNIQFEFNAILVPWYSCTYLSANDIIDGPFGKYRDDSKKPSRFYFNHKPAFEKHGKITRIEMKCKANKVTAIRAR